MKKSVSHRNADELEEWESCIALRLFLRADCGRSKHSRRRGENRNVL